MQNLAIVNDQTDVEVKLSATAKDLCDSAQEVVIMTRHDLSRATDLVKIIKMRSKEIEEERTRLVKPFNDGVKAINARFKAIIAPLEDAESEVKNKMLVFQKEEEQRVREEAARVERARIEAEAKAQKEAEENGNDDDIRSMPLPTPPVQEIAPAHRPTTYGQTGAVSTVKKMWAFELTDIKTLAAVRPDLVVMNEVEINREIRGKGGKIPGLRIYEKEIMQVR